eukprot:GGOE01041785.1.p1 GENE.GGOE01041785.1~~GGOE01041785.1.p1  ORF type:complete len:352 (-),score=107.59 GGOE01041785.1:487-1446(-)
MSSQSEARLQKKFPHVAGDVLKHLVRIFGGDHGAVQDQLQTMSSAQLRSLETALQEQRSQTMTPIQRQRVKEFCSISAVKNDKTAIRLLVQNGWDVENALNAFFSGEGMAEDMEEQPKAPKELISLFEKYKAIGIKEGASETTPNMEGAALNAFSADLDPTDEDGLCLYLMAFAAQAQSPMVFTREEFVEGLSAAGHSSLDSMRRQLPAVKSQLKQQPAVFRDFYRFCFDWLRSSPTAKVLDCETACDLWALLFSDRYPLLPQWLAFVREHHRKAITRDVWAQFLDFTALQPGFTDYDVDGAWPSLFDEFVDHMKVPAP